MQKEEKKQRPHYLKAQLKCTHSLKVPTTLSPRKLMKQRHKEHDVTFLPKREREMKKKSRRQTPQTPESEKGRGPVLIIKARIS